MTSIVTALAINVAVRIFLSIMMRRHQQRRSLWLLTQGTAKNKTLTRPYNLWRTGVTTDGFTPKGAVIMAVSVLLYGIIQVCSECIQHTQWPCMLRFSYQLQPSASAISCQFRMYEHTHPAIDDHLIVCIRPSCTL